MKYELRNYQQEAVDAAVAFFKDSNKKHNAMLVAATGCHAKGYGILMYDGTIKNVEDIVVGDVVMGDDSTPRHVLALHSGVDEMYRITPIKGKPFIVNGGHILSLYKTPEDRNSKHHGVRYDEISVRDYLKQGKTYKHVHKLYRASRVDFPCYDNDFPIDPYFLGLYLGDGSTANNSTPSITTMRSEVEEFLYRFAEDNKLIVRKYQKPNNLASTYFLRKDPNCIHNKSNPLSDKLQQLGLKGLLSGEKFIPQQYLTAPRTIREKVLAGLFDTDSHKDTSKNEIEYCSKSYTLATQVVFLCRSLGLSAKIGKTKFVNGTEYYRIVIDGNLNIVPNRVQIRKGEARSQKKSIYVTGFSIESVGEGEYYGFTLDGNHLYCDEQFFVHHNSGKSIIISAIAQKLNANVLVFQPNKEILQQNYDKAKALDLDCSMYSASVGEKVISPLTFATIGSVKNYPELFADFDYIFVDECQYVSSKKGMYKEFFKAVPKKVLGLTATPYRLESHPNMDWKTKKIKGKGKSELKMMTKYRGAIFKEIIYNIETGYLVNEGYLSYLSYYDLTPNGYDSGLIKKNTSGSDYDEKSLSLFQERFNTRGSMLNLIYRVLHPKLEFDRRNGVLVFVRGVEEAKELASLSDNYGYVSGDMPKKEREQVISDFKSGNIKVLFNAAILICGFDYPALDCVILATPTMSLARYGQEVGRAIRISPNKNKSWVIDLCGNYKRFGRTDHLYLNTDGEIWSGQYEKQLTGVEL